MSAGMWSRHGRSALYLVVLVLLAGWILRYGPQLLPIWRVQAGTLLWVTGLMMLSTVVQASNFLAFLDMGGRHLRLLPLVQVWSGGALLNYLVPFQPGVAARVGYLARHGVPAATSLIATGRQLGASVWLGVAGTALGLWLMRLPQWWVLALIWCALPLATGTLLRMALDRLTRPVWLMRHHVLLRAGLQRVPLRGMAGVALQYGISTVLLYLAYSRFGGHVGWGHALLMTCAVYLSSLVSVLPGNLGVMEGIYLVGGMSTGLSTSEAGALALLLRIASVAGNLAWLLLGTLLHNITGRR